MKRKLSILLSLVLLVCAFTGCKSGNQNQPSGTDTQSSVETVQTPEKDAELYAGAVEKIKNTPLKFDNTSNMTEDILVAIQNEEFTQPKNVIFMIGDGMGFGVVKAAEYKYKDQLYNGTLTMNMLPVKSSQSTVSASSDTTDSAAGGTALSTGFKTANSVVAMNKEKTENLQTTLELAASLGKSTGVVATTDVTDATPADFTAHATNRDQRDSIALQQIEKMKSGDLDFLAGTGRTHFDGRKTRDAMKELVDSGITYIENAADFTDDIKLPVCALLQKEGDLDTYNEANPTLSKMTAVALDKLSENEKGFFLMVEGSAIDHGSHSNDLAHATHELYQFDDAVTVALRFVALNPDTVLIISADHETGGLNVPDVLNQDTEGKIYYTTSGHSGRDVPVYAVGYGAEALAGINDNTDLAKFAAKSMGVDNFGRENTEKQAITDLIASAKKAANSFGLPDSVADGLADNLLESGTIIRKGVFALDSITSAAIADILAKESKAIEHISLVRKIRPDTSKLTVYSVDTYVAKGAKVTVNGMETTVTESGENYDLCSLELKLRNGYSGNLEFVIEKDGSTSSFKRNIKTEFGESNILSDFTQDSVKTLITDSNPAAKDTLSFNENMFKVTLGADNKEFKIPAEAFAIEDLTEYKRGNIKLSVSNPQKTTVPVPELKVEFKDGTSATLLSQDGDIASFAKSVITYPIQGETGGKMAEISAVYVVIPSSEALTVEISDLYIYNE